MTDKASGSTPKAARTPVDWIGMKPHYEAGIIPLKQLGAQYGCSDAAIVKHAKKEKWQRNLAGRIAAAAEAKVSAAAVSGEVNANRKAAEAQVVEVNATLVATVRLAHREDIARARRVTMSLLAELEAGCADPKTHKAQMEAALALATKAQAEGRELSKAEASQVRDAVRRAQTLPTRAATLKTLTESMRVTVALERQAFGIRDGDPVNPNDTGFMEAMLNARARAAAASR